MNETERLIKKDKRSFVWIIGKKGQALETRYNVIKGEEVKISDEELKKNNEKLKKIIEPYYKKLKERLDEYLASADKTENEDKIENEEKIDPKDIPF
jgi:deoxyribodipyrimidine photolyase